MPLDRAFCLRANQRARFMLEIGELFHREMLRIVAASSEALDQRSKPPDVVLLTGSVGMSGLSNGNY
jgi:hypothetical protein